METNIKTLSFKQKQKRKLNTYRDYIQRKRKVARIKKKLV